MAPPKTTEPEETEELDDSSVEQRRLEPLLQDWSPEALSRHFVLTPADLAQVERCNGSRLRFAFALHLLITRFLHVPTPPLAAVPEPIRHFISLQLAGDPDVVQLPPEQLRPRDEHIARIRQHLGVRLYAKQTDEALLEAHLLQRALHRPEPTILLEEAETWLRRAHILYPAASTLRRIIGRVRPLARQQIYTTIVQQCHPEQRTRLDALLERPHPKRESTFAWLKEPATRASRASVADLIAKRTTITETEVERIDLTMLNRNRVQHMAKAGQRYSASALRRFHEDKRHAILSSFLQSRLESVTDDLIETFDVLVGDLFADAERDRDAALARQASDMPVHLQRLRAVGKVVLDPAVPDDQVRQAAFAAVPQPELARAVNAAEPFSDPAAYDVLTFARSRYAYLRQFFPKVLKALPLTSTAGARPILTAVQFIIDYDASHRRWKRLPEDAPVAFVPARWRDVVIRADRSIDHRMWMLCLADTLRTALRSADVLVPGSRQHRDWQSYLHSDAAWAERRSTWFVDWHAAPDARRYLQDLSGVFDETVARVEAGWDDNPFARFDNNKLVLSTDDKVDVPASAQRLRDRIAGLLPRIKLPDLLLEVDSWVGYRQQFTHLQQAEGGTWSQENPPFHTYLFAVLLAQGCNLPLQTMADAAELPYHQLVYTADWFVHETAIRKAIAALVNYHHALPLAASFGPGTSAMSDGIRFGVTARSLYARRNPKQPTRRPGVSFYDTTSDQGSQPYIDVIRCDVRESIAVLDAVLHHETELPLKEIITDTHGYTEIVFGLFELISRVFSPRIRDLATQILYPMAQRHKKGPIGKLFRGAYINQDRIHKYWDEMHRIAASLVDGTISGQLLISKLQALKRQSGTHKGVQELGRIFKTLWALNYLSDEGYRRRIHKTLNKGELLHALARELFFGQQGLLRERDYTGLLNRATGLSLLINAIVVWNTRYMMAALEHLRASGELVAETDLAHLTPFLWEHISMHGSYYFDVQGARQRQSLRPLRRSGLVLLHEL